MDLSTITEVRDVALRSTGMSDYERCPRYFLFRHRAGLVPKGGTSPALQRGDIFHKLQANIIRGMDHLAAEQAALDSMAQASRELAQSVGPAGYLPNGLTPEEAAKSLETNTRVAIAMSRAYAKTFQVGPLTIGGLRVLEDTIEMPIDDTESGTLDLIAVDDKRGEAYVIDHKTCGWDVLQYARTLPLSPQALIYPRLLVSFLRKNPGLGLKPAGICYNIIKTPSIRCCKTDDWDLTKYSQRVERWYAENERETMLRTFIRQSHELGLLSEPRLENAARACFALPVLANFPATGGSACQAYNSLCPYLGLCTRDTVGWTDELKRYDRSWRDEQAETGD